MQTMKALTLLFVTAGCTSPMAGEMMRTSTMSDGGPAYLLTASDDENEDGRFDGNPGRPSASQSEDETGEGVDENGSRSGGGGREDETGEGIDENV